MQIETSMILSMDDGRSIGVFGSYRQLWTVLWELESSPGPSAGVVSSESSLQPWSLQSGAELSGRTWRQELKQRPQRNRTLLTDLPQALTFRYPRYTAQVLLPRIPVPTLPPIINQETSTVVSTGQPDGGKSSTEGLSSEMYQVDNQG